MSKYIRLFNLYKVDYFINWDGKNVDYSFSFSNGLKYEGKLNFETYQANVFKRDKVFLGVQNNIAQSVYSQYKKHEAKLTFEKLTKQQKKILKPFVYGLSD